MKKRYWITLISIVVVLQLVANQVGISEKLQLILIFAWLSSFYFDTKVALLYVGLAGFIYELLTFNEIGIHGLSFSIGSLFVFLAWKYMNFSDKSYRRSLNTIGLSVSIISFFALKYFYNHDLNVLNLVVSIVLGIILFQFLSQFIKINSTNIL